MLECCLNKKLLFRSGTVFSIFMLAASGCTATYRVKTGYVSEGTSQPRAYCRDFAFADDDGNSDSFSHVRGPVSVIVFPDHPRWPDCDKCRELADFVAGVQKPYTPIVLFTIKRPADRGSCPSSALHRCEMSPRAKVIALCDHKGQVERLWGGNLVGRFVVVGHDGRIVDGGSLADRTALEVAIRSAVDDHEREYWAQQAEAEWDQYD